MARTIHQQIAATEAKLARLKTRQKASETRRKIIVGAVVISEALKNPDSARRLAGISRIHVTRDVDRKELVGLMSELDALGAKS